MGITVGGIGRWAVSSGLPCLVGHNRGATGVRDIARLSIAGRSHAGTYTFSTENWTGASAEVEPQL